jgi:hypothetical protein
MLHIFCVLTALSPVVSYLVDACQGHPRCGGDCGAVRSVVECGSDGFVADILSLFELFSYFLNVVGCCGNGFDGRGFFHFFDGVRHSVDHPGPAPYRVVVLSDVLSVACRCSAESFGDDPVDEDGEVGGFADGVDGAGEGEAWIHGWGLLSGDGGADSNSILVRYKIGVNLSGVPRDVHVSTVPARGPGVPPHVLQVTLFHFRGCVELKAVSQCQMF